MRKTQVPKAQNLGTIFTTAMIWVRAGARISIKSQPAACISHEQETPPCVPFCHPHHRAQILLDELAPGRLSLGDDKSVSQARQLFALCLAPFNVSGQVQLFSNRGAIDTPDLCQVEARQFVEPLALNAVGGPLLFPASGRAFLGLGPPLGERMFNTITNRYDAQDRPPQSDLRCNGEQWRMVYHICYTTFGITNLVCSPELC